MIDHDPVYIAALFGSDKDGGRMFYLAERRDLPKHCLTNVLTLVRSS